MMHMPLLYECLLYAVRAGASDLHLYTGERPCLRLDGILSEMENISAPDEIQMREILDAIAGEEAKKSFFADREADFGWTAEVDGKVRRFRVSASLCMGKLFLVLRLLRDEISSFEELGLPAALRSAVLQGDGLFLVTGRTGTGKSTTLAAMVESINEREAKHIVTIEDPVEYIFTPKKSRIHQREVGADSGTFLSALIKSLRQDIDVIVIGELRDQTTIEAALTAAETGHLVLATLHTRNAAQSIERIVDVFPREQQQQVRLQLSLSLGGVFSQQLVPSVRGKRVLAGELLIANRAVRTCIREAKTEQLKNIMQTSSDGGMTTMDRALAALCRDGVVTEETARQYAYDHGELEGYLC